jgi:hypothetical protein
MTQAELLVRLLEWQGVIQRQIEMQEMTLAREYEVNETAYHYALGVWETLVTERGFVKQLIEQMRQKGEAAHG